MWRYGFASRSGARGLGVSKWDAGSGRSVERGGVERGGVHAAGATFVLLIAAAAYAADDANLDVVVDPAERIAAGHDLFVREWNVDGRHSVSGDGLGPMYNAASCAKCHRLGGLGGAGANDANVDLLTIKVPRKVAVTGGELRRRVAAFHPALAIDQLSATTVLHRFSPNPNYDAWRRRFLSARRRPNFPLARIAAYAAGEDVRPLKGMSRVRRLNGMAYQHSERNTPALFGAGLIDSLPDSVFTELQQRQASLANGVSGKTPRAAGGHVGRFGWRGQSETLHDFVLGACAAELGLEAPGRSQPIDPLEFDPGRPIVLSQHGLDISEEQCKLLTQFVAHLPPPRRLTPADDRAAQAAARGEARFEKIGCADCHIRQVAHVDGIYSDLLLHDMGAALEDPVPASPGGSTSYYGGGDSLLVDVRPEPRREWRTPPLWGAADSAPYLHDGRARTFAEAIAWHGGEGAASATKFRSLTQDEQEEVLAFLHCLAAPTPEKLALENIVLAGGD